MTEMPAIGDPARVGIKSVAVGDVDGASLALSVSAWLADGSGPSVAHAESSAIDARPTTNARQFLISVTADLRMTNYSSGRRRSQP
jgi:hypothetical protein